MDETFKVLKYNTNRNMKLIVYLCLIKICFGSKTLSGHFFECSVTEQVDLNQDCEKLVSEDIECQSLMNNFVQFSLVNENEFQFFNIYKRGKEAFYTSDGLVFRTTCDIVKKVYYDNSCKDCTKTCQLVFTIKTVILKPVFIEVRFLKTCESSNRL